MNGNQSNDLFFDKKKEKKLKQALTIKFIICLLLSHAIIFLWNSDEATPPLAEQFIPHKDYELIQISLNLHVPLLAQKKTPISLYAGNKRIIEKAFVYPEKVNCQQDQLSEQKTRYNVEIKKQEIHLLPNKGQVTLGAWPIHHQPLLKAQHKRGHYEVKF